MASLKTGSAAPAFSLENQDGKRISLADFKGKKTVVLYFYPAAMTPGCTVQACGLRDSAKVLAKHGAVAIGVSPDKVAKLKKFAERDGLAFDLLSDPDHAVADAYGAWGKKKFMGREVTGILRSTFVIGKDGKIKHVMDKVATKTHHDDVLAVLAALG